MTRLWVPMRNPIVNYHLFVQKNSKLPKNLTSLYVREFVDLKYNEYNFRKWLNRYIKPKYSLLMDRVLFFCPLLIKRSFSTNKEMSFQFITYKKGYLLSVLILLDSRDFCFLKSKNWLNVLTVLFVFHFYKPSLT